MKPQDQETESLLAYLHDELAPEARVKLEKQLLEDEALRRDKALKKMLMVTLISLLVLALAFIITFGVTDRPTVWVTGLC